MNEKRLLAVAFVLVLACACKKSGSPVFSIEGQWQLRRSFGGGGMVDTTYPSNEKNLLEFYAPVYTWLKGLANTEQGTFRLEAPLSNIRISDPRVMSLYLRAADTLSILAYQSRDTLILNYGSSPSDGIEDIFIRK